MLNTVLYSSASCRWDPGSTSDSDGYHIIHAAVCFPGVNCMPAIIREILRRRPDAASVTTTADVGAFLPALGLFLRHKASCRPLEIVEQLLQAYPAGISIRRQGRATDRDAVQQMWPSCACWQLARHRQCTPNRHPWLQPDAPSAIAGLVLTWSVSHKCCTMPTRTGSSADSDGTPA
jgi:hypothetical protein